MQKGRVIQLLERERGFIKRQGVKEYLFFHADHLSGVRFSDLSEGDPVQFPITETMKGPYATDVSRYIAG